MVGITGRRHLLLALCVGALLAGALSASEARACGGFFCSQVPMEQRGERIVFGFGEGRVSSIIQIDYTGEAEDFGWVVPVTGVPTSASVAPLSLFNELTMRTEPSYYLDWQVSDQQCGQWMYAMDSGAEATAGAGGGHDGVEIAFEQEVGPYNVTVLSSTDAAELLDWLDEHGFDQPGESVHLIQHYLDIDMKFAAVKLKRGASVGEVQPLRLDFEAPRPCVPLVLTRIAALPDMPVYIWVLAETRAVPTNWFNVILNEAKIDWVGHGSNYDEVARDAIDQAAGHGFITEYAGQLDLTGAFHWEGRFDGLQELAQISDPSQFLDSLLALGFPRDAQTQALIRLHIPMPPGVVGECADEAYFYNWSKEQCFEQYLPEDWSFDPAAFVSDLEARIVVPLQETQALVDEYPYTTRLFSIVSDHEMTRDPMFELNGDLGDVSNHHQATATGTCDGDGTVSDIRITLESGRTFSVEGSAHVWGGWATGSSAPEDLTPAEPAAARIELLSASGAPQVIAHSDVIAEDERIASTDFTHVALDADVFADAPPPSQWEGAPPPTGGAGGSAGGSDGCTSARGGAPGLPGALGWLMAAAAWLLLRRRSRIA